MRIMDRVLQYQIIHYGPCLENECHSDPDIVMPISYLIIEIHIFTSYLLLRILERISRVTKGSSTLPSSTPPGYQAM